MCKGEAVLREAATVKERQTNVGIPNLGYEGSVPESGWLGVRRREEKGAESLVKDREAT